MKRYEVKQISNNWYGIWDNVMREYVIESTSIGIEVYRKIFNWLGECMWYEIPEIE
jgi:hypothetical protein